MKIAILAVLVTVIAACGVEPPSSGEADQQLCHIDPTTGRCAVYIDPEEAAAQADLNQAKSQYLYDSAYNARCGNFNGGLGQAVESCEISITWNGTTRMVYCNAHYTENDDGSISLDYVVCGTSSTPG